MSILIIGGVAFGRYLGSHPGAKVSMMSMRPPYAGRSILPRLGATETVGAVHWTSRDLGVRRDRFNFVAYFAVVVPEATTGIAIFVRREQQVRGQPRTTPFDLAGHEEEVVGFSRPVFLDPERRALISLREQILSWQTSAPRRWSAARRRWSASGGSPSPSSTSRSGDADVKS